MKKYIVLFLSLLFYYSNSYANTWNDGPGGATRQYYNAGAKLPWDRELGDWLDKKGDAWGEEPFAKVNLHSKSLGPHTLNVRSLILTWLKENNGSLGLYLRGAEGVVKLASREAEDVSARPRLFIETESGQFLFEPIADTFLDSSTVKSLGHYKFLKVSAGQPALINFNLGQLSKSEVIKKAELRFEIKKIYGSKATIKLFQIALAPSSSKADAMRWGVAKSYPFDNNISSDPEVYYSTGFEGLFSSNSWFDVAGMGQIISADLKNKFQPLVGRALSASIPKGKRLGLNQRIKFKQLGYVEPEQAYFRYYLRLADNWDQTVTGGKLPGFAGTYNRAGWGGRKPDGFNGWSTRGGFLKTVNFNGIKKTPIGSYFYHLNQESNYGIYQTWARSEGALLENNRWYCIEQFVKLNDPNKQDGEVKAWVDGRLVFRKKGLRFRLTKDLKIEEVWLNLYHGGMDLSPKKQTVYMDNLVVSKKYIGPINFQSIGMMRQ